MSARAGSPPGVVSDQRETEVARSFPVAARRTYDSRFNAYNGILLDSPITVEDMEEVLRDAHFRAAMQARLAETLSRPWSILPATGYPEAAEVTAFIEGVFDTFDTAGLMRHMLEAVATGYSVAELFLGRDARGRVVLTGFEGKPWHWFTFDREWNLRFIRDPFKPMATTVMPEPRVLCHTHAMRNGSRRGEALAELAYWYVYFKKCTMKYGLQWLEQFGAPTRFVKTPKGIGEKLLNELMDAVSQVSAQTVISLPAEVEVQFMQVGSASTSEQYRKYIDMFDRFVSKLVVGNSLVLEGSQDGAGSRAAAQVHQEKLRTIAREDARGLMGSLNRVIRLLVAANFGKVPVAPAFYIPQEPSEVNNEVAKVYFEALDRGVPIVALDFYQRTGIQIPRPGDVLLTYGERNAADQQAG